MTCEPIDGGYRWRFPHAPNLLARLGAVLDAERTCCPFLHIRLEAEAGEGTITVEITGPPGTREFLATWLPPAP